MSDVPFTDAGSVQADYVDVVQREWDRFAMPDASTEPEPQRSLLALTSPISTNATIATRAVSSLSIYTSTTASGDDHAGSTTCLDDETVASCWPDRSHQ
jgi:hypothetical protein